MITDLDLDPISALSDLEELNLGVGVGLGQDRAVPVGREGICRVAGGIQITDLGLAKLAQLKKLRRARPQRRAVTPAG